MKKVIPLFLLICAYFFPIFVYAEGNSIKLKSIALDEKSDTCTEVTGARVEDNNISLDLKMTNVGDYAIYKIVVKNQSSESIKISTSQNTNSNYIKYTILENDITIKKSQEKTLTLKVEYVTKASNDVLVNGELEQNIDLTITATSSLINPKTASQYSIFLILIALIIVTLTIKSKEKKYLLLLLTLLVPNIVLAANTDKIIIHSKVLLVNNDYIYTVNIFDNNESTWLDGTNTTMVYLNRTFPATIEKFTSPALVSSNIYLKHKLENNVVKESYLEFVINDEIKSQMAERCDGQECIQAVNALVNGTYALRGEATGSYNSHMNFTCKEEFYNSEMDMCVSPYYESNVEVIQEAFGPLFDENYCSIESPIINCNVLEFYIYANKQGIVYARNETLACEIEKDGSATCMEVVSD